MIASPRTSSEHTPLSSCPAPWFRLSFLKFFQTSKNLRTNPEIRCHSLSSRESTFACSCKKSKHNHEQRLATSTQQQWFTENFEEREGEGERKAKRQELIQRTTDILPSLLVARDMDRAKVLKWLPTYLNVTGKTICYSPKPLPEPAPRPQTGSTPLGRPRLQAWKMMLADGHIHLAGMKRQELSGQLLLEAVCDLLAPATLAERLSSLPWHSGLVLQSSSVRRARKRHP